MLTVLLLKELRESVLSLKFQIVFAACGLLALIGAGMMVVDCEQAMRDHRLLVQTHRQMLADGDASTVRHNMVADLPLDPWQRLVRGASGGATDPVFVHQILEPYFLRPLNALSANASYPTVDLLFIVTGVLSLLAVLLGHDLVSREHEFGTLKMILSHAVSRDVVIAAKWLGGFVLLVASVGVLFGLAALLLACLPTEFSLAGAWGRMVGMAAIALLLLSALFTLGLLVSCRCRQAVNALVVLLFLWVLLAVVVPSASPYLASFVAPAPSVEELTSRRLSLHLEMDPPGKARPTLTMAEFQQQLDQLEENFQRRMDAQTRLTQLLSYLSPVATGAHLMADLAGSGLTARARTTEAVRDFRRRFAGFVDQLRDPVDLDAVPRLEVARSAPADTIASLRPGILVLVLYNVLAFLGAHVAFLRRDLTA